VKFVNGMLAGALSLGTLASGMVVVNFAGRSWASRRIAEQGSHTWAEGLLLVL
jgi:hypothetical protein